MRQLEAEGEPTTESFFLEIRRRQAHCDRQLGDVPWVSCPGVGTAQVVRMVRKAAG